MINKLTLELFLIWFLLLFTACHRAPVARVVNHSSRTLSNVVFFTPAFTQKVTNLRPGEDREVRMRFRGSAFLRFDAPGKPAGLLHGADFRYDGGDWRFDILSNLEVQVSSYTPGERR